MATQLPEPEGTDGPVGPEGPAADDALPDAAAGDVAGDDAGGVGGAPGAAVDADAVSAADGGTEELSAADAGPGPRRARADLTDADVDHRFAAITRDFAELPGLDRRIVRSPVTDDLVRAGPRDHTPQEDDEGFVPPDPVVHVADRRRVVAWSLVLGPVVVWLALVLSGQWVGPLVVSALGACVLVGAIWLVLLLPSHRDGDDPGAVV